LASKASGVYGKPTRTTSAPLQSPSVIWQLEDKYEKVGSDYRRKYWLCGLCTKINEEIIEASEHLKNWQDRGRIQQLQEEKAI
jgi:hypothetical protein